MVKIGDALSQVVEVVGPRLFWCPLRTSLSFSVPDPDGAHAWPAPPMLVFFDGSWKKNKQRMMRLKNKKQSIQN
jgi:hypothetical protein